MLTIKKQFRKDGFVFDLVKVGKKSLIYKKTDNGTIVAYEVHKIRTRPTRLINGIVHNNCIRRPSDEDFGYWASSCYTLEKAEQKYLELEEKFKLEQSSRKGLPPNHI